MTGKPTVKDLGIDVASLSWRRSADGEGVIEVAFVSAPTGEEWILMRVSGEASGRTLVYDRNEWECFLDGVRKGEFDNALGYDTLGPPGHGLC